MKLKINTPAGPYIYRFKPLYQGIKPICKEIAKENLFLFKKICEANNIDFLLFFGTLLGAVRDKDFISHDEDIDLALLDSDLPRFLSILFELRKHGFEVVRYERRGFMSIIRKSEYIDLYFFSIHPNHPDLRYLARDIFPKEYVEQRSTINFLGETFFVPADSVGFLASYYGENWQTPIAAFDFHRSPLSKAIAYMKQYFKALSPFVINEYLQDKKDKPAIEAQIRKIRSTFH
ncbi:MAG: LicD family protein [Prevotellaceae bacterium]|nr:LicD family protein [Prevotellaceae bacterium]